MNSYKIAVASGKGGTGKTTVACGLAYAASDSCYIDCDVEEPNGHLLLNPNIDKVESVYKSIPSIDFSLCNYCGKCSEICEYNALIHLTDEIYLSDELCHSCGVCSYFCPQNAITEIKKEIGTIRIGKTTENILFWDGYLRIGEAAAAPLIKALKSNFFSEYNKAETAHDSESSNDKFSYPENRDVSQLGRVIIIDSPPGTSCSMVETVKDADYCILVTESTPFGLSDLKLAVNVLKQINIKFGIVINKYDESFLDLEEYLRKEELTLLAKIPFSMSIAKNYSKGKLPAKEDPDSYRFMVDILKQINADSEIRLLTSTATISNQTDDNKPVSEDNRI